MVSHACYSSTWELEAGGSAVQIQPWLHTAYESSLGYTREERKRKKKLNLGSPSSLTKRKDQKHHTISYLKAYKEQMSKTTW